MTRYTFQHSNLYGPESPFYDREGQLQRESKVYFYCNYTNYGAPDHPKYLTDLKNTYLDTNKQVLLAAKRQVHDIIYDGIFAVMEEEGLTDVVVVCAPRAKALKTYAPEQLYFIDAVNEAAEDAHQVNPRIVNGVSCIQRHTDTKTTHLQRTTGRVMAHGVREAQNNGSDVYPGICADTCEIKDYLVRGKIVILVDDIYTKSAHVDVDMMNALYNSGASLVYLLTVARTCYRDNFFNWE